MAGTRHRKFEFHVVASAGTAPAELSPLREVEKLSLAAPPLLGREEDIAGVSDALEVSRLVTLTGAPGVGKTTLALAVAERHPTSAVFVELAPMTDPGRVLATLSGAVGLRPLATADPLESVAIAVEQPRTRLLVVDNCEHLLSATKRALGQLLAARPGLCVLATSREPLELEAEREWRVAPLRVPGPDAGADHEQLLGYPAVELFVERARDVQPGFELNAYLAADVVEICRRLEGVPLAIELAAARVSALTPGEIVRRLEDRLNLLNGGGSSSVSRHRTLSATLDWSHALLRAPERALLRRLSVFTGRFELDAATAACAGEQVDPPGVPALLDRLVAKSLVVKAPDDPHGYRLMETVRAYASQKLEQAGEGAELRTAHARFYLGLAERAEPEFTRAGQQRWLDRLDGERADVCAAVEWSLSSGQAEMALRLAGALVLFWRVRGHYPEGRDLLATALAASEGASPLLRARAQWGVGFLTLVAGDPKGALADLEESLAASRDLDDARGEARSLLVLADAQKQRGDPSVAAMLEVCIRRARQAGDSWCLAHALGAAGFESSRHNDLRRGRRMFEECIAVARDAGDLQELRYGLIGLGELAVSQGDYREAQSLLEEAVELARILGEDYDHTTALLRLGELASERGDYAHAEKLLEEAVALLAEVTSTDRRLTYVVFLAAIAHAQGDHSRARSLLDEVKATSRDTLLLLALAQLAAAEGNHDDSRRLLEEARDLARARSNDGTLAKALYGLGQLARDADDPERAVALHEEALSIVNRIGKRPRVADSLEAIAGLAAAAGHHRHAARLFGATEALRELMGYAGLPEAGARREADMALLARSMRPGELRTALSDGRRLSLADAVREASSSPLCTKPTEGWATLTAREREVAELVAQGLTNPEIAERLKITRETVKTHVSNTFAKLGVTGRWELAREVRYRTGRSR